MSNHNAYKFSFLHILFNIRLRSVFGQIVDEGKRKTNTAVANPQTKNSDIPTVQLYVATWIGLVVYEIYERKA